MSKMGLILLAWVTIAGKAFGQPGFFVLIRSESHQAFYVRIGEKTMSSSGQGYLIIPELKDSTYRLTIGFPKNQFPEQSFTLVVGNSDHEFLLENQAAKDWVFVQPRSGERLMLKPVDTLEAKPLEGVRKDDAFSRMMAGVVNDTAVMYSVYTADLYLKDSVWALPDTSAGHPVAVVAVPVPVQKDTAQISRVIVQNAPDSGRQHTDSAAVPKARKLAVIKKIGELYTASSLQMTYTEHGKGHKTDTINLVIPLDSVAAPAVPQTNVDSLASKAGMDTATLNRSDKADSDKQKKEKPVLTNSDCHNFATEQDVSKLKAKLSAATSDEARMAVIRKLFKIKCMSTNQLRSIADAFTQESSKYEFLETAYPSDADDQFASLVDIFTDPVYVAKFKSLVGIKGL